VFGRHGRRGPTGIPTAVVSGVAIDISADLLEPNDWNPNVMTDGERDRLRAVIRKFGFLDPLTVRRHPSRVECYQIIDGEHRWEVGVEEGLATFPCTLVEVDDDSARMLTPILNELHGQPDSQKLGEILRDLQERHSDTTLRELMPYSRQRFDELVGQISVDWEALEQTRREATDIEDRWVERVYRMPALAAEVVDGAVVKAREESGAGSDWQGLEYISAEFMGR
jgi:ParB-like chromosome segregation protein Spo0J